MGDTASFMDIPYPLESDSSQRRQLTQAALDLLDQFFGDLDNQPVHQTDLTEEQLAALGAPPPEEGRAPEDVFARVATANSVGALHPSGGFMAYIPNCGLFSGALGAFVETGLNRYTGVTAAAPGFVQLENTVLEWMEDLFELPDDEAAGVLLSGGSMANFTALVAARTARLPDDFSRGTIYVTPHVHHSITKAARLAGFPAANVRTVGVDSMLRMDADSLVAQIGSDRADGYSPFLVVASAGTTDTGTVDPLSDLAAVAHEHGLWFHVDAAYGGFFQLTERGRKRLVGIGSADSITLDPHKGLSIPFGVGALLVRDRATLIDANGGKGAYLQDQTDDAIDFSSLGPELTRPFRGLHVWLPLQLHGVGAFRSELEGMLDLAEHAYSRLRQADWVERIWRPDLSIVAFQCRDDERARQALEAVNSDGRIWISSTTVDGRYTIRLALLNRRTTRDHVDLAIDLLADQF